jgi:hypothetical protein
MDNSTADIPANTLLLICFSHRETYRIVLTDSKNFQTDNTNAGTNPPGSHRQQPLTASNSNQEGPSETQRAYRKPPETEPEQPKITQTGDRLSEIFDTLLTGNRLPRPLPRPSIRLGSLATNRETDTMTHPTIALDFTQAANILRDLTAERSLDRVITLKHRRNPTQLLLRQIAGATSGIDLELLTNLAGGVETDAIEVS